MSLRLRQAIAGRPNLSNQNLGVLEFGGSGSIVYPSASNVVVLNHELELRDTLQFWSALPHRVSSSSNQRLSGLICDDAAKLIIAWSDVHIVLWRYTSKGLNHEWSVHSTLVASSAVQCADFVNGVLCLGTKEGIEVWSCENSAAVVVWDRLWERSYPTPSRITLSPLLAHIAWFVQGQPSVHVLRLDRKRSPIGIPQDLRHPREIESITWRKPKSDGGDDHLYTITTNSVFRIYAPVIDDPTWFQLLSSLDGRAFSTSASAKGKDPASLHGTLVPLDARVIQSALQRELVHQKSGGLKISAHAQKLLTGLQGEEGDVIAWFGRDGTVSFRSIVNIDRKPPTLLKSLPLARLTSKDLGSVNWSTKAQTISCDEGLLIVQPATSSVSQVSAHRIDLAAVCESKSDAIVPTTLAKSTEEVVAIQLEQKIDRFVRTPNGRGLLSMGESGEVGIWYKDHIGKVDKNGPAIPALLGKGHWVEDGQITRSAIFAKGRAIVFCRQTDTGSSISLQHLDPGSTIPSTPVPMPNFELDENDAIEMLLAVSDIDDGYSGQGRKTQKAIIIAASRQGVAWVWRADTKIQPRPESTSIDLGSPQLELNPQGTTSPPEITLVSKYRLPVEDAEPALVLPVDPMGWHQSVIDWKSMSTLQDVIVTVSKRGVLEFWSPELGHHFGMESNHNDHVHSNGDTNGHQSETKPWYRTSVVRTGRNGVSKARCSSRKKTVLVCERPDGSSEITVWDSKVSEFSTGIELTHEFPPGEAIRDLDWTTTSDLQSVLAVGFAHKVLLLCEKRMSYVEKTPGWAPILTIDLEKFTSIVISDSIWLAGGSLAVGAGNQVYVFSRFLDRNIDPGSLSVPASTRSSVKDASASDEPEDIFQLVAWENGPLWDYHPTVLAQCLVWNKVDLVKSIIVDLVASMKDDEEEGRKWSTFKRIQPHDFLVPKPKKVLLQTSTKKYEGLFDTAPQSADTDESDAFSQRTVTDLAARLDGPVAVALARAEKDMLINIAQATLEVERERRSLDICGLRYLLSIRLYTNQSRTASGTNTPISTSIFDTPQPVVAATTPKTPTKLSFRNFVWAMHSESQDMLLTAANGCCQDGKMDWNDAKRLGVFLWLKSNEVAKTQLEVVARNKFMSQEQRDPTSCSLMFFALGKKKVVHGLWRQAPGHKEQQLMLKFLNNDFELDRWKMAAIKNAYALLSKQRYEYAAAFFMLGGAPKDAINVCLRQMNDWQLAFTLARIVENGLDGELVKWVVRDTVIPLAFEGGHRWLASWAFWILNRRDLSVRVLISPMTDIAVVWSASIASQLAVGNPENDDPSLLLLFQHLKSKSLQTAKGTSEIAEKTEFDFVLHNARVFFRMGCHSLGLDLLHSWSFSRPFFPSATKAKPVKKPTDSTPLGSAHVRRPSFGNTPGSLSRTPSTGASGIATSPTYVVPTPRRPSFMLTAHGRRESMVMDMDVLREGGSESSTRAPTRATTPKLDKDVFEEEDEDAEKAKTWGEVGEAASTEKIDRTEGSEEADKVEDASPKESDGSEQSPPPKKMGNLMKELKQDVQQGGMEFDMDSFF